MAALKTHQDYLYQFYASLVRQRPNSKMAIAWLLKHGYDEDLLPMAYLSINPMSKKIQKPKTKLTPAKMGKELKEEPAKTDKKKVTEKKPSKKKPITCKAVKMETA